MLIAATFFFESSYSYISSTSSPQQFQMAFLVDPLVTQVITHARTPPYIR